MTKQLNKEQLAVLEKYERFFNQAVGARYCSYPGQAGVTEMLSIWNEVTKENRTIRQDCSTCIFHLVVDLGTLYLAQKAEMQKEAEKKALEKAAKEAAALAEKVAEKAAKEAPVNLPAGGIAVAEPIVVTGAEEVKPTEEKPAQEGAAPSAGSTAQPKSEKPATGKGKGKGKK